MNSPLPEAPSEREDLLRFEMLLTELSARRVGVTTESIDNEIVNAQRQIVEALHLDRCTLGRIKEDHFVVTHSGSLPDVPPLPGCSPSALQWFFSIRVCREILRFCNVEDLPAEAEREERVGPVLWSSFRHHSSQSRGTV
jgi:hypothetical protein